MQNGVIVYLSRTRDLDLLMRSLILLARNFKQLPQYPIVVFHDDIDALIEAEFKAKLFTNLHFYPNIKFQYRKFVMPENFQLDPQKVNPSIPLQEFGIGYRHMCRFHSGEIYKDPALLKYEWYWRLDSDSYIFAPIKEDPFDVMALNGYVYGYLSKEVPECPRAAEGLWEETKAFIKQNGIKSERLEKKTLDGNWDYSMYYTNFEISNFSFWRGKEYQSYYNAIDKSGKIYYNRWGDAPIHWFGVNMFLKDSQIHAFKDIGYQHNNWVQNLNTLDQESLEFALKVIDEDQYSKRRSRLKFGYERYVKTGNPGLDWED